MAGTLWKGSIHFQDTQIAVKLHSAIKEDRIEFHLLHQRDLVKLRQQMICAHEQLPVPPEAQLKGFEVADGRYIIVDPQELEATVPESSRSIDVHEFVKVDQIDPLLRAHSYHLEPDSHIESHSYSALVKVLLELELAGICTWVMRKRAYHGAIQALGKHLRLHTLRYADEVIAAHSLELEKLPLSERELQIGSDLIRQMSAPFQPQKFINEHQRKLRQLLDQKARGAKLVLLRPRLVQPTSADQLLQALEASLKQVA